MCLRRRSWESLLLFSSYSTINRLLPQALLRYAPRATDSPCRGSRIRWRKRDWLPPSGSWAINGCFLPTRDRGGMAPVTESVPSAPRSPPQSLNDNVPSVFLMNDFGIAGVAGVSLVLLMMGLLWIRALRTQPDGGSMPLTDSAMLSLVSMVTWLYTGFYMMFANCGILLFTGKNVFLWGLNSTSDLFSSPQRFLRSCCSSEPGIGGKIGITSGCCRRR